MRADELKQAGEVVHEPKPCAVTLFQSRGFSASSDDFRITFSFLRWEKLNCVALCSVGRSSGLKQHHIQHTHSNGSYCYQIGVLVDVFILLGSTPTLEHIFALLIQSDFSILACFILFVFCKSLWVEKAWKTDNVKSAEQTADFQL